MSSTNNTSDESKPAEKGFLANLLDGKTPGVANIEAAYSRAGGTNHHLPGHASQLGSQEQGSVDTHQGVGSKKFAEGFSDQRQEVKHTLMPWRKTR